MSVRRARHLTGRLAAAALLVLVAVAPVAAQSPDAAGSVTTVTAHDYWFEGLPTSVPAGTQLGFTNEGTEVHQLVVVRRNDDTTETWQQLLEMGDAAMEKVTVVGQLMAAQGATAEGSLLVEQEGQYLALCFVPQGTTEMPDFDPNASPDPSTMPPAGLGDGPPHLALGMLQEFTVTAPGTAPGPLPPAPSMAPMPEARIIEIEAASDLQFKQDGQQLTTIPVKVGETITFRVTNTAGFAHNLWIGPDAALAAGQVEGLPGIPDFVEGTQEFTWTVPENAAELMFGCTATGHYAIMKGTFTVEG